MCSKYSFTELKDMLMWGLASLEYENNINKSRQVPMDYLFLALLVFVKNRLGNNIL